jgi:hypothetical protein
MEVLYLHPSFVIIDSHFNGSYIQPNPEFARVHVGKSLLHSAKEAINIEAFSQIFSTH